MHLQSAAAWGRQHRKARLCWKNQLALQWWGAESTRQDLEARTSRLPRSRGASRDALHWGGLLAGGRGCLASGPARLQREKTGLANHPQEGELTGRLGGYMALRGSGDPGPCGGLGTLFDPQ